MYKRAEQHGPDDRQSWQFEARGKRQAQQTGRQQKHVPKRSSRSGLIRQHGSVRRARRKQNRRWQDKDDEHGAQRVDDDRSTDISPDGFGQGDDLLDRAR